MNREFEQDIWEIILKAAVVENSLNESKKYPSIEEINRIELPKHYDVKMRNLIKHYVYRKKLSNAFNVGRKIASIAIIIMGISFTFLLQYSEVRAACQNVIVKIYEQYIRFSHNYDITEKQTILKFGYIPEGFKLYDEANNFVIYKKANGESFTLYYYSQKYEAYIDNEHYSLSNVNINGHKGIYFESEDKSFENVLLWDTPSNYYVLYSSLPKEEIIKIAVNLK